MSTPEKTSSLTPDARTPDGPVGGGSAPDRRAGGATAVLDPPVAGATDVVEALTTEAAIAEVHQRLGPDARILDARRVLRGGIGGFFAKEHVQLHAAPGEPSAASVPTPSPTPTRTPTPTPTPTATPTPAPRVARPAGSNPWAQVAAEQTNAQSPVDRLLAQADEVPDEGPSAIDFATFLRDQLGPEAGNEGSGDSAAAPFTARPADDQLAQPAWPRIDVDSVRIVGGTAVHLDADGEITADVGSAAPAPVAPIAPVETIATVASASAEAPSGTRAPAEAPVVAAAACVPAPTPTTATSTSDGLDHEPAPAQDGGPGWSVAALLGLGLPVELVRSLEVDEPYDDIAWTMALAEALRPSCRPLPDGPAVFVGPRAEGFAHVDDAPVARSATWLAALRPGRWIHLVIGGDDWRRGLAESPLAASWAGPDDLADAIRCAVELGLVLGYGPTGAGMRRARPLDVALAVRDLVVNR